MKILLVDGSNVVRSAANHTVRSFEEERKDSEMLISLLNRADSLSAFKIEVYFDGPKRRLEKEGNMDIFFSKYKKADENIVNAAASYKRDYKADTVFVVTSDRELGERCRAYGAIVVKSETLLNVWLEQKNNWLTQTCSDMMLSGTNYTICRI